MLTVVEMIRLAVAATPGLALEQDSVISVALSVSPSLRRYEFPAFGTQTGNCWAARGEQRRIRAKNAMGYLTETPVRAILCCTIISLAHAVLGGRAERNASWGNSAN